MDNKDQVPACNTCYYPMVKRQLEITAFGQVEPAFVETNEWVCKQCSIKELHETIGKLRAELADALSLAEAYKSACEYLQAGVPTVANSAIGTKIVVSSSWDTGDTPVSGVSGDA